MASTMGTPPAAGTTPGTTGTTAGAATGTTAGTTTGTTSGTGTGSSGSGTPPTAAAARNPMMNYVVASIIVSVLALGVAYYASTKAEGADGKANNALILAGNAGTVAAQADKKADDEKTARVAYETKNDALVGQIASGLKWVTDKSADQDKAIAKATATAWAAYNKAKAIEEKPATAPVDISALTPRSEFEAFKAKIAATMPAAAPAAATAGTPPTPPPPATGCFILVDQGAFGPRFAGEVTPEGKLRVPVACK